MSQERSESLVSRTPYLSPTTEADFRQALMIHGGGHLLFSRKDIPMKHVRTLLKQGYLPVSVDYRLCPEMTLYDGPVTDCCDALKWAREVLPTTKLSGPAVSVDPDLLLALGWSSGGQLAMTLGYTPQQRGLKPPDVILPFYSPSDLEAGCKFTSKTPREEDHAYGRTVWWEPIYPAAAEESPTEIWGELDCVRDEPVCSPSLSRCSKSPRADPPASRLWNTPRSTPGSPPASP